MEGWSTHENRGNGSTFWAALKKRGIPCCHSYPRGRPPPGLRCSPSGPSWQPHSLRTLHPAPHADERAGLGSLRRVSSRTAPSAEVDQVRKALRSFPSTSGAGRSGLGPSHIRDAMRPASADLLLRLLAEVVNLLLQGEVRESVRPLVCDSSIVALRKPNGSLRPIAIGESIRRITSKVAVELISDRARPSAGRLVLRPLWAVSFGPSSTGSATLVWRPA